MARKSSVSRRGFMGGALAAAALGAARGGVIRAEDAPVPRPAAETAVPYRFRFSLNAGTIRGQKLGLTEQFEVAAKAGYEGYEPWTSDIAKFIQTGGVLKDLGKRCKDLGLHICGAIGFAAWIVDDDAQRAKGLETLKKEMEQVSALGGTYIAAPPAGLKGGMKVERDRIAERYRAILELGKQTGVIPELEIWGGASVLSNLPEALYVASRAAHPDACILADAYHLYKGGTDISALRLASRSAFHVFHMNDYPATPEREKITDAHRIWPGDGVAPLKELLAILAANHCDVMLSLELFNADYYKLPAEEAARIGLAKLKAVVKAANLA